MPRYQFDSDESDSRNDTWVDSGSRWLNLAVRVTGLILLVVGFVVILMVIGNAWSLYDDPSGIEPLAREIERGSNLDLTLSSAVSRGQTQVEGTAELAQSGGTAEPGGFRFSYFVAWAIAIVLLLLIGRLAIAAVRTGGELALYDVKVGKLARALLRERTRMPDA